MSLINQMLKDLEARKQRGPDQPRQEVTVVACQAPHTPRLRPAIIGLAVLIVFGAAGGWWWASQQQPVVTQIPLLEDQGRETVDVSPIEVPAETVIEPMTAITALATSATSPEEPVISQGEILEIQALAQSPVVLELPPCTDSVASRPMAKSVANPLVEGDGEPEVESPVVASENSPSAPAATLVIEPQSVVQRAQQLRIDGRALVQQQRYQAAGQLLNQALQIDHSSAQPWQELVRVYVQAGDLSRAMDVATRGCKLYPSDIDLRIYRARLIVEVGDYAAALTTLQAGELPSVVSSSDYYALLASVLQQLSRFDEAGEQYALLTTSYPQRGDWWIGRAICVDQLGSSQQAIAYYQQAMTCQQLNPQLKQFAVQQLTRLGKG